MSSTLLSQYLESGPWSPDTGALRPLPRFGQDALPMAREDGSSLVAHCGDQLPLGRCSGVHTGGRPRLAATTNSRATAVPGQNDQDGRVDCRCLPGIGPSPRGERTNQGCGGVHEQVGPAGRDRDGGPPADLGRSEPGGGPQTDALAVGGGKTRLAVAAGWGGPFPGWAHDCSKPAPVTQGLPTGEATTLFAPASPCPADHAPAVVRTRPPASPHSH